MTAGVVLWQGYRLMSDVETTIAFDWPIIGIGMILFAGGVSSFLYHPPSNRRNDNEN